MTSFEQRKDFNNFRRGTLQRGLSCPFGAIHLLYVAKIHLPKRLYPQRVCDIRKALKRQRLSKGAFTSDRVTGVGESTAQPLAALLLYGCGVPLAGKGGTKSPLYHKVIPNCSNMRLSRSSGSPITLKKSPRMPSTSMEPFPWMP